jgi:hypothetical protein
MNYLLESGDRLLLESSEGLLLEPAIPADLVDDIFLRTEDGRWVSVFAGLIRDDLKINDKTWSSQKTAMRTQWKGEWGPGSYEAYDQVEDQGWLMIANKTTADRPAPQPAGDPAYLYTGTLTPQQVSASQAWIGGRYTPQTQSVLITGFRVYMELGQDYRVYSVEDPAGANPIITELLNVTDYQGTPGWNEFNVSGEILSIGETMDIVALVKEPDPAPVTVSANYDYQTPQNPTVPTTGTIQHSRGQSDVMSIHYTDSDTTDRTALLQALTAGDTIVGAGLTWTIQTSSDQGTYINFTVTPAAFGAPTGVQNFDFNTNAPQPIDYQQDTDFWLGDASIKGLFIADDEYSNIVPNDNQYIIDVRLQDMNVSPDWDFQAVSGGSSTSQQLNTDEILWVASQSSGFNVTFGSAMGPTWQEIGRRAINDGEGFRIELVAEAKKDGGFGYAHNRLFGMVSRDGASMDLDYDTIYEHSTEPLVEAQIVVDGFDVVFEARTPAMEMWKFKLITYFNELGDLL